MHSRVIHRHSHRLGLGYVVRVVIIQKRRGEFEIGGFTSYARNSKKKQYLIFGEIFLVLLIYQLFVWHLFGQNPIEIIIDKIFVLDFAKIVTKQLINKQN